MTVMARLQIVDIDRPEPGLYFGPRERGFLDWDTLIWRFAAEKSYWLATMGTAPHTMPVWGIWQQDSFRFSTYPHSKKARNLRHTPSANVHLANTEAVLVMECNAVELESNDDLQDFVDDYNPKYKWNFTLEDVAGGVFALTPHTAFAWAAGEGSGFHDTATRWHFQVQD